MPNIATLLKTEISRIARKEIRKEVVPIRKSAAGYRRDIADLKRLIAALDKKTRLIAKLRTTSPEIKLDQERPIRFVAKGLVSLRKRLGLSADELARLLGVSMQSVYNWEHKKAMPRKEQVTAIAALRGIGRIEARQRLEERGQRRTRKNVGKRPSEKRATQQRLATAKRTKLKRRRRAN